MSESATLTGPGTIGDINVEITITAVPGPSGAYYNLEYKISGATAEDAAKLCSIKDLEGFLNTNVGGLPPGVDVTNRAYLNDKFGGMVAAGKIEGLPAGAVVNAPDEFGAQVQEAVVGSVAACKMGLLLGDLTGGNFSFRLLSDGSSLLDFFSADGSSSHSMGLIGAMSYAGKWVMTE